MDTLTKSKHGLHFPTMELLVAWLRGSIAGQALLADEVQRAGPRRQVLVVLSSDGWTEVYSQKTVDVMIVNKLHASSPEAGLLAEEYLESALPKKYREVYFPVTLRAIGQARKVTAQQVLDSRIASNLIRELVDAK